MAKVGPQRKPKTKMVRIKVKAPSLKPTTRASVLGLVKRMIDKKSETKYVSRAVATNIIHNSGIVAPGDFYPLVPACLPGDGDNQRHGDSIRPSSLRVKCLISPDRTQSIDNKVLLVRVMILASKSLKSESALLSGGTLTSLLRPNFSTGPVTQAFTGQQNDLFHPVNADDFRVYHDKIYRISCISDNASVEENPDGYKKLSFDIETPAELRYDETSNQPTNFCPFMCLGYAYADGTGPDVVRTRIIFNATSQLKYKDF